MFSRGCIVVALCCFGSAVSASVTVHALPAPLTLLRETVAAHARLKPATITLTQTFYEFPPMKTLIIDETNGFGGPYRPEPPPPSRDSHAPGKECSPYGKATRENSTLCRNDADNWLETRVEPKITTVLYVSGGRLVCHTGNAVEYSIGPRREADLDFLGVSLRAITSALSDKDAVERLGGATVTRITANGRIAYKLL